MKMNIRNTGLSLLLILLAACHNGEDKADAYGNFEATDKLISAETNGRVLQLDVEEGQSLEEGQVIAFIDTTQLSLKALQLSASRLSARSRIEQIRASEKVMEAQKAVLLKDYTRVRQMYKDKAATGKQLDDLKGQLDVLETQQVGLQTQIASVIAEMGVIDAQLAEVYDQLERCTLKMPSAGTVLQKFVEQGEMAVTGRPVVKVADLEQVYLRAFVSGSQLPGITIGQKVEVIFDKSEDRNQSVDGTISWISAVAEFTPKIVQTKEERVDLVYAIKVAVTNDGRIKIGMPGEVRF